MSCRHLHAHPHVHVLEINAGGYFLDLAPAGLIGACIHSCSHASLLFLRLQFVCLNFSFFISIYAILEVNDWLETLVEEKGEDLYRMKRVVSVNDSTGCFVFSGHLPLLHFQELTKHIYHTNLVPFKFFQFILKILIRHVTAEKSIISLRSSSESDEKGINELLFIGRNLDEAALRKAFKGCLPRILNEQVRHDSQECNLDISRCS